MKWNCDGTFKYLAKYNKNEYISVKQLYNKLGNNTSYESVARNYNSENIDIVNQNIFKFYYHFFFQKRIVMLLAYPSGKEQEDNEKLFDLFVRLNTGGENLNGTELSISKLKAFHPQMDELFCKLEFFFEKYPYRSLIPFNETPDNNIYMACDIIIESCFKKPISLMLSGSDIPWIKSIDSQIDIDSFFNFICLIFKICRIVHFSNDILYVFVYDFYTI